MSDILTKIGLDQSAEDAEMDEAQENAGTDTADTDTFDDDPGDAGLFPPIPAVEAAHELHSPAISASFGIDDILPQVDVNKLPHAQRAGMQLLLDLDNVLGRLDYPFFVTKVLGHDFPEIWDPTVQKRLERTGRIFKNWVRTRGQQKTFRKVMFVDPRGTCKSAGTTIPLVPYAHNWDTELAAMIMSASYDKMAVKFASTVKQVWDGESPGSRLVELYGPYAPASTRKRDWSKDKMVTQRRQMLAHADPTLSPFSIAQGPTSGHFKIAIIDDPVTEEILGRDGQWLEKCWNAYNRMPFVLDNDSLLVLIMTRYDDNDLIGRIIVEEVKPAVLAEHGELPSDWDEDRGWIKYAHLAGWEVFYDSVYENYNNATRRGDVVYPIIWPHERIAEVRKTARGEALFQLQLQQNPAAREDAPITWEMVDKLYKNSISDIPKSALRTIDIHCDFSFKEAANYKQHRGDWGVAHVVAKEGGQVYRIGGYRGKRTQTDFGEELMKLVSWVYYDLKSRVRYITYELPIGHGSGDESTRMWLHQLFMRHPDLPRATAYPIKRYTQGNLSKLQRMMNTVWAWQEGYVTLIREADGNYPLCYQMVKLGYTTGADDDADAFADCFYEKLYKKTRVGDLPDDISNRLGLGDRWAPLPAVHGHFDRLGNFIPERRTARNPGTNYPSLFGKILGRD